LTGIAQDFFSCHLFASCTVGLFVFGALGGALVQVVRRQF
jgi:hypothetical protein